MDASIKANFDKAMSIMKEVQEYCKKIEYDEDDDSYLAGHCINCVFGTSPIDCYAVDKSRTETPPIDWGLE